MKRNVMIWAAVLLTPLLAWASPQDRRPQGPDERLRDYLNDVAPVEEDEEKAKADEKEDMIDTALREQAASPAGTATAAGFADRVNNTLQNFLPLFQGAIQAIDTSDDKRTVTLRLNPIRAATFGELGLSAATTEPEPSEALLKLLPDDTRPGQKEAIQKTLDDFADLTYAATYNYVRKLESEHLTGDRRWFFGRNPRLYEEVFAQFVGDTHASIEGSRKQQALTELADFSDRFPEGKDLEELTRDELKAALKVEYEEQCQKDLEAQDKADNDEQGQREPDLEAKRKANRERQCQADQEVDAKTNADYERLIEIKVAERQFLAELDAAVEQRAKLFSDLVANQPQATLSLIYHDRDPLVGRNETSVDLSIEMPSVPNINELLRSWRSKKNWTDALDDLAVRDKEIASGTKWSLAASYKDADAYKVSFRPSGADADVSLDLPRSHEFSLKAQYTRRATWQPLMVDGVKTFPAFHVAAEVIEVSDNSERQDRRVVTLTYDVPMVNGMSVPVSLVYANRSEFLGDPDHRLSAHIGLNLNALMENQGN